MRKSAVVLLSLAILLAASSAAFAASHEEDAAKPYGPSLMLLDQFIREPDLDGFKALNPSLHRTADILGREGMLGLIKLQGEEGILMILIDMMDELELIRPDVEDMAGKDTVLDNVALGVDAFLEARESIIDVLAPRTESSLVWDAISVFACPAIPGDIMVSCDCHDEFLAFTGNPEESVTEPNPEPWSRDAFSNLETCYDTVGGGHALSPNLHSILQALGSLAR